MRMRQGLKIKVLKILYWYNTLLLTIRGFNLHKYMKGTVLYSRLRRFLPFPPIEGFTNVWFWSEISRDTGIIESLTFFYRTQSSPLIFGEYINSTVIELI